MATISKLNALQAALLSGTAFAGFMLVEGVLAPPAQAQVHLPQTGTLSNAQPIFCVNPTTLAVEDCVANVTVGNISSWERLGFQHRQWQPDKRGQR